MREHGLLVIDSVESDGWRRRVMAAVSDDDSSQLISILSLTALVVRLFFLRQKITKKVK